MKKLLIILPSIFLFTCGGNSKKEMLSETIRYPSPSPHYKRDSLYIAKTVSQFIDKGVENYDFFKQYNMPLSKIGIYVDSVMYSSDSLKLFAFVILKVPDHDRLDKKNFYYTGDSFIGYRDSINQPWKIYKSDIFSIASLDTYNELRESFRKFFFVKLRTNEQCIPPFYHVLQLIL